MREHQDGDFPFANDFNAVVRDALASGTLVSSGCTVDGSSNGMTVSVASGDVFVNGSSISVSSQTVTLADADANDDRYDLVVVDDTGSATDVTGTASSTPQAPSIPSNSVLLAIVEVPAGAIEVTDAEVDDARAVVDGVPNDVVTQGSGSGLDADTLDGNDTPLPASVIDDGSGSGLDADTIDGNDTPLPASAIDDGAGSGLDADTVDGQHASELKSLTKQSGTINESGTISTGDGTITRSHTIPDTAHLIEATGSVTIDSNSNDVMDDSGNIKVKLLYGGSQIDSASANTTGANSDAQSATISSDPQTLYNNVGTNIADSSLELRVEVNENFDNSVTWDWSCNVTHYAIAL